MQARPRFASASHVGGTLDDALDRVADRVVADLDGTRPDVAFLFVSPAYGGATAEAGARLRARLGARHLIGSTAIGVLETSGETERGPSLSVLAGSLPGARLEPFELRHDQLLTMNDPHELRAAVGFPETARPLFVLLADPFTLDADLLLQRLNQGYDGARAVGGLVSGGTRPGTHLLYMGDEVALFGAVGLAISGIRVRTVVSQGCRPVGRRFVITRAERNKVLALSGQPALPAIQEAVSGLPEDDRELARTSLLIGRAAHEARERFDRGDFVIRSLMGVIPEEDAVVVGDKVRVGQTVQLQLRDGSTATEDLDLALAKAIDRDDPPSAALMFSCAGRGEHLFGVSNHDMSALRRHAGDIPAAGFFCNGEIGDVGGRNFVHGFTVASALF
jgi:small ligand-binding sensory domain FIST